MWYTHPQGVDDVERGYLQEKFSQIEDVRHQSYVEHPLVDVLILIMSAVLCGLDQLADIMEHAICRATFFRENFGIERIPSKPTMSRILNLIDGASVAKVIVEIMREKAEMIGSIIAVDGKAIRSTSEAGKPHSALQILTAYLTESGVVIGQEAIHDKTNEIPVFQAMLDIIDVRGKMITADALHCQRTTCWKIVNAGGNYVFGLKGNQKTLYDDVSLFIEDKGNADSIEIFTRTEKGHGRIEKRTCMKVTDISWLEGREEWAGLKAVFAVRRMITTKHKTAVETNYYITSADLGAEELLRIVREHWKIESLHWMLDVVFSEDECALCSENGQKTLNILRKLALLLHKKHIADNKLKTSVKASLLRCLISDTVLKKLLAGL
jgi:predicted transposase YbfD/YdcC